MTSTQESEKQKEVILLSGIYFYVKYVILAFILVFLILFACKLCDLQFFNVVNSPEFRENVKKHLVLGIFLISFLGPLVEETIFRLWLSFKRVHIFMSTLVIIYYILSKFLRDENCDSMYGLISMNLLHFAKFKIAAATLFSSWIFFVSESKLKIVKLKYGNMFSIVSILFFSLIHLSNLECSWYCYPIALLLCSPQFILGLVTTYYRRNLGFLYGLVFHCIINLLNVCTSYGSEIARQISAYF